MAKRYDVRRFAERWERPDGWEVFDTTSGKCASFGMTKKDALSTAARMNREIADECDGCGALPHAPSADCKGDEVKP
jgi:hypothetical protein